MRLRAFLILLLVIALFVGARPFRGADTLPISITDGTFWKLINEFSEPGGTFSFEMYMSNESTFQRVLPELLERVSPGGVYLGVAPEQNFTYIAAVRPKMAFIIDIRRENMLEMLMYKALFELSSTRTDFLSRLFSRSVSGLLAVPESQLSVDRLFSGLNRRGDTALYQDNLSRITHQLQEAHGFSLTPGDLKTIDGIYSAFFRGGPSASLTAYGTSYQLLMQQTDGRNRNRNFLASDANYQFVRQMHQKNLIIPVVGDFAGPKAIRAVAGYIREHGAEVKVFYVSNVEEYISSPRSVWAAYCRNLATLPVSPIGTFIRFGRGGRGSWLDPMPSFIKNC